MTLEYIAGFFDGEGSTGLYRNPGSSKSGGGTGVVLVSIGQCNYDVLAGMQVFLAKFDIASHVREHKSHNKLSKKQMWYLSIQKKQAVKFLEIILPYLIVKKTIVQDILRIRKLFPPFGLNTSNWLRVEARWPQKAYKRPSERIGKAWCNQ